MPTEFHPRHTISAAILAGATLLTPALASTGFAAHHSAGFDISGTFAGEHGTSATPSGTVAGHYERKTHTLHYTITYSGLSGAVVAAHFHGPAASGAEAGVLVPIAGPYASPIDGTVTLTNAQAKEFRAGQVYVNLHTAASPTGEARAQIATKRAAS